MLMCICRGLSTHSFRTSADSYLGLPDSLLRKEGRQKLKLAYKFLVANLIVALLKIKKSDVNITQLHKISGMK